MRKRINNLLLDTSHRSLLSSKLILFCFVYLYSSNFPGEKAFAQETWTGGAGTTNWSDGQNWASGASPPAGSTIFIGATPYAPSTFPVITTGQNFTIGDVSVGFDTNGQLIIQGRAISGNLGYIGQLAGSTGNVTVDGTDSLLAIENDVYIGFSGNGTLTISGGALVDSNQFGHIGFQANSIGMVTITGAGSQLDTFNSLFVGQAGEGTLLVESGGLAATGGNATLGESSTGNGTATISGPGSRWSIGGNLIVGDGGTGELTITNGGQVINGGFAFIGNQAGSNGLITVSGTDTRWNAPTNLFVGFAGTGSLTITDGAVVTGSNVRVAEEAGSTGTINIGADSLATPTAPGSLNAGNLLLRPGDGRIVFNHNDTSGDYLFSSLITGDGQVNFYNGTTTFYQPSTYGGTTTVFGGTLIVDNETGSATGTSTVHVASGGTLRGSGSIAGAVTVDGVLAPGSNNFGVLTVGSLTLNSGATTRFRLTDPFASTEFVLNDRIDVIGSLTLGGTLDATISAAGVYRLFNYGGTLAGAFENEIYTSGRPGFVISNVAVDTSINGQVNLIVLAEGQVLQFWDGTSTAPSGQPQGTGGPGIWNSISTNWTNEGGTINGTWGQSVGVFAGAAGGAVQIEGTQGFDTLQFITDGYTLSPTGPGNGALSLNVATGGTLNIESGINATINAPIIDGLGNELLIIGGGTIVLNGANTYSGGTTVSGSTVQISGDDNLGQTTGGLILDGGSLRLGASFDLDQNRNINIIGAGGAVDTNGFDTTIFQAISGNGDIFIKTGTGTLSLAGINTYTGQTIILGGTLALEGLGQIETSEAVHVSGGTIFDISGTASGATIQSLSGAGIVILGSQTLTIDHARHTFSGNISGSGGLNLTSGVLVLSGINTYSGSTSISGGSILSLSGAGQISQSQTINLEAGSEFDISTTTSGASIINLTGEGSVYLGGQALTITTANGLYSGSVQGSGSLTISSGTLTLSGMSSYTGGTTIAAGRLIATNDEAMGTGAVTDNGTLELNFTADGTLANQLTGSGALEKTAAGTATLTAAGSSVGAVTVTAGTLALNQSGTFNAASYTTATGAITDIGDAAQLVVANGFVQAIGSELHISVGGATPITAQTASLAGNLFIDGFTATPPASASELPAAQYTIIHTTGGITGDFSAIDFGVAVSNHDYLTLSGGLANGDTDYNIGLGLTWLAGPAQGNGVFTLAAAETFNVDVVLADQTGPFISGWNGSDLTKNGAGTLTLSAANTYTGVTLINGGTLSTGIADAFAQSSSVTVASGATLALNGFNQTANNLSGAGAIALGSAVLTVNNTADTTVSGTISGTSGSLVKTGASNLTLSGANTYTGGTTITAGRLIATNDAAMGTGAVTDNGTLELNFTADGTLANQLTGSGAIEKTAAGTATLSAAGSSVGAVTVTAGTLALSQSGAFNAAGYTTATGAITDIGDAAQLVVANGFVQAIGSELHISVGGATPITAQTASLAGNLFIDGFSATPPASASELPAAQYTIIHTTGGITGDFSVIDFGGAVSNHDYLTLSGGLANGNTDYNIGLGLTWLAGPAQGNGVFTLAAAETFNVDVVLADQTGPFISNWNGSDLTKNGAGTLTLSAANTYTGQTIVNGGTLRLAADSALGNTSLLSIAGTATVDLGGTSETIGNLTTQAGSQLLFNDGSLTISDTLRTPGDLAGGSVQANTLFGNGNLVIDPSVVQIYGANNGYTGNVTISGGSQLIMNNAAGVGSAGSITLAGNSDRLTFDNLLATPAIGTLQKALVGSGIVETRNSADITLAGSNNAFSGTFDIAAGTVLRASAAAHLGTGSVTANGTFIATASTNWTLGNSVSGTGLFVKDGAAQLLIGTALSGFSGQTSIANGALVVGNSAMNSALVAGNVQIEPAGILSGTGLVAGNVVNNGTIAALNTLSGYEGNAASNLSLGHLTNSGIAKLSGSAVGNTLTISGGLTGNSGSFIIGSVLNGDSSPTDKLIINGGAVTGVSYLVVVNKGGNGSQTNTGILVVDAVNGATTGGGVFTLSSSSSGYRSGNNSLAIGAYDYSLVRGGNGGQSNSWYLTSAFNSSPPSNPSNPSNPEPPIQQIRPEAGSYLANREAAENMFIHSLRDRLDGYQTITDPVTGWKLNSGAWARVYGNRRTTYSAGESLRSTVNTAAIQAGMDLFGWSNQTYGQFRAGVMFGKGSASGDTIARRGRSYGSSNDVDGFSVGAYATWFQHEEHVGGFYVDAWVQHGWFDNTITGGGLPKEKYDSRAWSASLEAGYSLPLRKTETSSWFLDPFAQLIYTNYKADRHIETGGTLVRSIGDSNVISRIGGRFYGQFKTESGKTIEPFLEASWWHNGHENAIFMNDDKVRSNLAKNIAELKVGLKSEIARNLYLSVDVSAQYGDHKYRQFAGQVGLRYTW